MDRLLTAEAIAERLGMKTQWVWAVIADASYRRQERDDRADAGRHTRCHCAVDGFMHRLNGPAFAIRSIAILRSVGAQVALPQTCRLSHSTRSIAGSGCSPRYSTHFVFTHG